MWFSEISLIVSLTAWHRSMIWILNLQGVWWSTASHNAWRISLSWGSFFHTSCANSFYLDNVCFFVPLLHKQHKWAWCMYLFATLLHPQGQWPLQETTWQSDAQDNLHFKLADTNNIAGAATEFLNNTVQTLSAWAVQRPGPILAYVGWTLSFGSTGRNACTDITVLKRVTHASGSIREMITILPVIMGTMQLC